MIASLNQALAQLIQGDEAPILTCLAEALGAELNSGVVFHAVGALLLAGNDSSRAESWLKRAVAADDGLTAAFNDLGVSLLQQGRSREARDAFSRALELDPEFSSATENQLAVSEAEALLEAARRAREGWALDEAMTLLNKLLGLASEHAPALHELAAVKEELGDWAEGQVIRQLIRTPAETEACVPPRPFEQLESEYLAGRLAPTTRFGSKRALSGIQFLDTWLPLPLPPPLGFANLGAPDARLLLQGLTLALGGENAAAVSTLLAWVKEPPGKAFARLAQRDPDTYVIEVGTCLDGQSHSSKRAFLLEMAHRVVSPDLSAVAVLCLATVYAGEGSKKYAEDLLNRFSGSHILRRIKFRLGWDAGAWPGSGRPAVPRDCLLIGTCIVQSIRYLLNRSDEFRRHFRLRTYFTNMDIQDARLFDIRDELIASASLAIHVHPVWADWGNEGAYRDLLARFPSSMQTISLPYPAFHPLWPFHCKEARNEEEYAEYLCTPMGQKPNYPYGDSMVLALMKRHHCTEEVVRSYLATDLADQVDLNRLLEKTLDLQQEKEAHTDIKIVDFIASTFRERAAFSTVNHISNGSALYMCNQILRRLDMSPLPETILDTLQELLNPESPIHPSVIRFFGLRYANEHTRYRVDEQHRLTYAEYLARYVSFC